MFELQRVLSNLPNEIDGLSNEMNRFLFGNEGPFRRFQLDATTPAVNVWHNESSVVVTADLPGIDADQLDVSLEKGMLTIKGEFADEGDQDGETFHRRERRTGQFSRALKLPFDVDSGSTDARYENGVLTIQMSRPEDARPKRITVQAV